MQDARSLENSSHGVLQASTLNQGKALPGISPLVRASAAAQTSFFRLVVSGGFRVEGFRVKRI